ncbi:MAG: hypothetical protein WCQ52_07820 [Actinomycetes bacterium]
MKTKHTLLFFSFAVVISGCSTVPPERLYDGPERPNNEIVRIKSMDSFDSTGNRLSYDWISYVRTVDGKPIGKTGEIRVLPGKHRVGMYCELNPRLNGKFTSKPIEIDVELNAGNQYFPWCQLNAGLTLVYSPNIAVSGSYTPYLSTKKVP